MFNFNINWSKIIKENLSEYFRGSNILSLLRVLISPFVALHLDFMQKYQVYVFKVRFTGQVAYLQKILNTVFSPNTGGIYIVNGQAITNRYLYRKSEGKPPQYRYKKWKSIYNYVPGDFAIYSNKVYKCRFAHTNIIPIASPFHWSFHKDVTYRRRRSEYNTQYDFIVRVPQIIPFNNAAMRALIDYYKLAGRNYKIEIY